ncbi:signal peptidase I [Haloarcula japonica]|uniref:signal peptidase I n=1 Tax=Haloarcula japonica TaxID=29282 RepID=UPI0039F66CBF
MTPSNTDDGVDWRRLANWVGLGVLLIVVGVFVATAVPQAVGADESYVVLSSSMSPAIEAGSVVFVNSVPPADISEGDVITYDRSPGGTTSRVTHRVVNVIAEDGQRQFRTKGDANEDPDPEPVSSAAVVGVVTFSVPYIGHVITFSQTRMGLLTLVVGPALLLVILEIRDLLSGTGDREQ